MDAPGAVEVIHQIRAPHPFDESWHWRAEYDDGTVLDEYDAQGKAHGFAEVDVSRLNAFILVSQKDHLPHHLLTVVEDARPIFFRRRQNVTDTLTGVSVGQASRWTCLGWQRTIGTGRNARNVASYTFFRDDGLVLVTNNREAVTAI